MSIQANGLKNFVTPTGGSPRGWSFISMAVDCWTKWANRYVYGLFPLKTPEYFDIGIAYHALQEGVSYEEVQKRYPSYVLDAKRTIAQEAKRLIEQRKKGPPLPAATSVEKEFSIFGGKMTSKPDRIEKSGNRHIARDFKTAAYLSKNDEAKWNVNGGILGECIAADTDTALVDIVSKAENAKPTTKIVTVKLTAQKRVALERAVQEFWYGAEARTRLIAEKPKATREDVLNAFTQNIKSCVDENGLCPYYSRCWERGTPGSMMYIMAPEPPRNWAEHKPKITWRKALDTAYAATKALV